MDVVAAQHGVRDESFARGSVIFRREIEGRGDAVGEVAGGTEVRADNVFVGLVEPFTEGEAEIRTGLTRVAVANDFEEVGAREDGEEQIEMRPAASAMAEPRWVRERCCRANRQAATGSSW